MDNSRKDFCKLLRNVEHLFKIGIFSPATSPAWYVGLIWLPWSGSHCWFSYSMPTSFLAFHSATCPQNPDFSLTNTWWRPHSEVIFLPCQLLTQARKVWKWTNSQGAPPSTLAHNWTGPISQLRPDSFTTTSNTSPETWTPNTAGVQEPYNN